MTEHTQRSMQGRICLITGANSGIGKATALGLARLGATVVLVCRNPDKGKTAQADIIARSGNQQIDLLVADLASQRAIHQLADDFKTRYDRLDVLVNNAGLHLKQRVETVDGLETTFAVNHLGYFLLTNLLIDVLKASAPSRIVNVASGAQGTINFDDLQGKSAYDRRVAYKQSKLANVLFTYELARRLAGTGVTANCLNPGDVRTNYIKNSSLPFRIYANTVGLLTLKSPQQGAETPIYLAASPDVEGVSGQYFVDKQVARSVEESYDVTIAKRLWDVSAKLTQLSSTVGSP